MQPIRLYTIPTLSKVPVQLYLGGATRRPASLRARMRKRKVCGNSREKRVEANSACFRTRTSNCEYHTVKREFAMRCLQGRLRNALDANRQDPTTRRKLDDASSLQHSPDEPPSGRRCSCRLWPAHCRTLPRRRRSNLDQVPKEIRGAGSTGGLALSAASAKSPLAARPGPCPKGCRDALWSSNPPGRLTSTQGLKPMCKTGSEPAPETH